MRLVATRDESIRPAFADNEDCWRAVQRRDRPSRRRVLLLGPDDRRVLPAVLCRARAPRRENVAFHATRDEAERAGFRPCKRCRPDEPTLRAARGTPPWPRPAG